ncbi:hypothetical protein L596_007629 [Steinernema carpocapsae]|uniref:Uncharacterized protein n=1 Tax=Steinernema carpocapsae TaxID=34508 RepID=A0A4U5P9Z5_STECR|nr:hypothetical protein L596_007629 [Steinernema carpocapsae]
MSAPMLQRPIHRSVVIIRPQFQDFICNLTTLRPIHYKECIGNLSKRAIISVFFFPNLIQTVMKEEPKLDAILSRITLLLKLPFSSTNLLRTSVVSSAISWDSASSLSSNFYMRSFDSCFCISHSSNSDTFE